MNVTRKSTNSPREFACGIFLSFLLITGCDNGNDDDGPGISEDAGLQAEFVTKAKAVEISRIRIFDGHVTEEALEESTEIDPSNLKSGELLTLEVEFQVTGELDAYALAVQLVPKNIFSKLNAGSTIGEVLTAEVEPFNGVGVVSLGAVYVNNLVPGLMRGALQTKLPTLDENTIYKAVVMPSLAYISGKYSPSENDVLLLPVLLDDRELTVSKLEDFRVELVSTPVIDANNDFTELEVDAEFDENGVSTEPILQSSIFVDLTSFKNSEEIAMSMNWEHPNGSVFPMSLLSSDASGNPIISTDARFIIQKTGPTKTELPIVAHVPQETHKELINQATLIQDLADEDAIEGEFKLSLFPVLNDTKQNIVDSASIVIPLVKQDNRVQIQAPETITAFKPLRAGRTNASCLAVFPDVDSGLLSQGDPLQSIAVLNCPETDRFEYLWRYDPITKQIINRQSGSDKSKFCLSAEQLPFFLNPEPDVVTSEPATVIIRLGKCRARLSIEIADQRSQEFEFDGNKIRLIDYPNYYLDVGPNAVDPSRQRLTTTTERSAAPDFFTDLNGLEVSASGQLFNASKFINRKWGSEDKAQVHLEFGGESFMDYLPVIGSTTRGVAKLRASLFSHSKDLIDVSLTLKRYFPKRLSMTGSNYPDQVIGNGAKFNVQIAGREVFNRGEITQSAVTEAYDPVDAVGDVLSDVVPLRDVRTADLNYKMDETFVRADFVVVVIPVTVEGGARGEIDINVSLAGTDIGVGAEVGSNQFFSLEGFLSAKVLIAGIEGSLELINQTLKLSADAGFNTAQQQSNKIAFDIGSKLDSKLKLLKGEIRAFADIPDDFCWDLPPICTTRHSRTLYKSEYLFNSNRNLFSKRLDRSILEF